MQRNAERYLALLLRLMGLLLLTALFAVFMPPGWMAAIHAWVGLGALPDAAIVAYLTRSESALYAVLGALMLYLSFDVRRYLPLIRFLALIRMAFGVGLLVLDVTIGMPPLWTICEGPSIFLLSALTFWLAGIVGRAERHESSAL